MTWWADKTPAQILRDVNDAIASITTTTNEVEYADTVLLPFGEYQRLANTPMGSGSDTTLLTFLMENNVYSASTGGDLLIASLRGLATADPGGDGRMVVYRRDPEVLRLHVPMPHRFLPPYQKASMVWEVAGIGRTGGLEIRLPKAIRYADGIVNS